MMKKLITGIALFAMSCTAFASDSELPKEFQGFTWNSKITLSYDDLDALLGATVLDVGMSDRSSMKSSSGNIGTRMRSHRNTETALEANRFMFEELKKSQIKSAFHDIRVSLEHIPSEIALSELKNEEQLAFWLNLYNVALLEKLINEYPIYNMEEELTGKKSILDDKFLTVAGHALSLNDIQHNIVYKKFADKPVVMYGFYQGNIGSPSLNADAYTGDKVYRQLEYRAEEFVNSNRGVVAGKRNTLKVSRFYEQSKSLFNDFDKDLKAHLQVFAEGPLVNKIKQAKRIEPEIEDWSITDIYGTTRTFGGGSASSNAAMLDAVVSNSNIPSGPDGSGSGIGAANLSVLSDQIANYSVNFGRFTPEQAELLQKLKDKQTINSGSVEIKDISEKKKSGNN